MKNIRSKTLGLLIPLSLLAGAPALAAVPGAPCPVVESAFPIMCWTYYPFGKVLDWNYTVDNWVRLGVNRPLTPGVDGKTDKVQFRAFLDKCLSAGLHVYVSDGRCGPGGVSAFVRSGDEAVYRAACRQARTDWADHPAVLGFYLFDEPDARQSTNVFRAAKIMAEEIPGKQPFLNLLPWYAWVGKRMGADALRPYLERCVRESGLSYLGYDYYSQQNARYAEPFDGWFENLREWTTFSRETGTRWNVSVLCSEHFDYIAHTDIDFRWQISTAVAMGAHGLTWFYPDHHGDGHANYRNAPINQLGERTPTFDAMGFENRIFQHQFGAQFAALRFERATMSGKAYGGVPLFTKDTDPDVREVRASGKDPSPVLVSFFSDPNDAKGTRYVALVNLRHETEGSRHVRLVLSDDVMPFQKTWDGWNLLTASHDAGLANTTGETGATQSLGIYLAPGQLALLRLRRK